MLILADSSATASLVLGAVAVVGALVAIYFAFRHAAQLRDSVNSLKDLSTSMTTVTSQTRGAVEGLTKTETKLSETQTAITGLSTDMATILDETKRSIADLSERMYEALGISSRARDEPGLFEKIASLTDNLADVLPRGEPYISDFSHRLLDGAVSQSSSARSGSIELVQTDIARVALELIDYVRDGESVFATSYVNTLDFWTRPQAKRYLARSRELIAEKGVSIIRIFLFDSAQAQQDSIEEMNHQVGAGIKVRTALTHSLEADLTRDVFLLGERLAAEYLLAQGKSELRSVSIHVPPSSEVKDIIDVRNRLILSSDPWPPHDQPGSAT